MPVRRTLPSGRVTVSDRSVGERQCPAVVVDVVVVLDTEREEVRQVGGSAVSPPGDVVGFAVVEPDRTAGDRAPRVHHSQRTSLGAAREPCGAAEVERLGWVTDLHDDTGRIDDDRHHVPAQGPVDDHRDRELDAVDTEIDVRVVVPSLDGGAEIDHRDRLRPPTRRPTTRRRRRSAVSADWRPVGADRSEQRDRGLVPRGRFAEDEGGEGEGAEVVLAFERVGGCGVGDPGVEPCLDLVTQAGDQRLTALGIELPRTRGPSR